MKEKILAFLMAKLTGIQKSHLEGIADKYANTITDETQIETTFSEGVLSVIKDMAELAQKDGDRRATEATNTAIANYEKKHNLKDGKEVKNDGGGVTPSNPPVVDDKTPEWAKAIIESNKAMSEKIEALEKEKTLQTKQQQASTVLKASKVIPDKFKEKWANRINVDSETSIEDQVKELEAEFTELHTTIVGKNSGKGLPTGSGSKGEVTNEEAAAIAEKL